MEITESTKIQWADYVPAVSSEPLNTYYQRLTAQSYSATGYSFVIKSPSLNAFMDPDVFIRFKFKIKDRAANNIAGHYHNNTQTALNATSILPGTTHIVGGPISGRIAHFGFRGGNIFQRATQQIAVTINGWTLSYEPWKWIDPLNRLYVSNSQSKHVFSGSGGTLDSGNHGNIIDADNYYHGGYDNNGVQQRTTFVEDATPLTRRIFYIKGVDSLNFLTPYAIRATENAGLITNNEAGITTTTLNAIADGAAVPTSLGFNFVKQFPPYEKFYNPGFSERVYDMMRWLRGDARGDTFSATANIPANDAPNLAPWTHLIYQGAADGGGLKSYAFEVYEPVPCPLFKMYHNDGVAGIIPHVRDMQIVATFSPNMLANLFRANYSVAGAPGFDLAWDNITTSDCEIFIKWYTPPMNLSIPREISLPLRKIDLYLGGNLTVGALGNAQIKSATTRISQYNISIDAVPDCFMIFVRRRLDNILSNEPDDFYFEITNLVIQLENNGGKTTQIHTYQMYQNWLKYAKHRDPVEMPYDEWRKYCCVALLKPEDYGVIRGPGYDNYIVMGITADCYNWYNAPTMQVMAANEAFDVANNNMELCVVSIFDRWAITLSDLGQAKAGLTRIRENNPPSLPGGVIPA